ncbi:helix-turn-helix domain-containing protein [Butyrivibrio sp. AE2032]|uniref:helix-turn-helix domain-containing protein n=1 Tax=Butyrivibrio sp. AE2032 TaxID=1458463 RepID=UPI00054EA5D4|nr:AraC family transcriptional regulator [Butyrivibrio sp. AE2032]
MELKTGSRRPGMDFSVDVFYEQTKGFSKYLNDPGTYKMVLVRTGSFVIDDNGEYCTITAPASIILNERADFKVVSESDVISRTIYFKPTFIREEFTFEALRSGRYEKFLSAVKDCGGMDPQERFLQALDGAAQFESCYKESLYQDALLMMEFNRHSRDIIYYSLMPQEYDAVNRMVASVRYDLLEQPDSFWILRVRYFIISLLFMVTADFYRNYRQDEIYKDPLVAKVTRYLWDHLDEDITLATILKEFRVNKNTLNDAFNREMSMSCMAYLTQLRINHAKRLLQFFDLSVSEVCNECGYKDVSYFSKVFKKNTGMSASEYQKKMKELC